MNKKTIICTLAALGFTAAIGGVASARSVSALSGQARLGAQAACFTFNFSTGAVTSTCAQDFEVPLTVDVAGNKVLNFTSRATAAGARCRSVGNNRFGTALSASAFVPVPVNANFVAQATGAVVVPGGGVYFADCVTNNGTSLDEFDYAP